MTWKPLTTGSIFSNGPLNSFYGSNLWNNMQHNSQNRLKKFSITYCPTADSTIGSSTSLPPSYDTTLEGLSGTLNGSRVVDPNSIGLQFSTPPTEFLCIPPVAWPLSAMANKINLTLNLKVENADAQIYAYARIGSAFYPADISTNSLITGGEITLGPNNTERDCYKVVGTGSSTNADSTYVTLTIDLDGAQRQEDLGVHGSSDPAVGNNCEIFIAFKSNQGDKILVTDQDFADSIKNGGSVVGTSTDYTDFLNFLGNESGPQNFHCWIVFEKEDETAGFMGQDAENKRHVVQMRPSNLSDINGSTTDFVIWPPILDIEPYSNGSAFEYYYASKITLYSVYIEEAYQ